MLRKYQELIIEQAKETNTIAFLPTGTGKTLIACYLVGHRVRKIRLLREDDRWKRVIVFIAPTKALLGQQLRYIKEHCPEAVKAIEIHGESFHEGRRVEFWNERNWKLHFERYEVLGMTPEVFRFLLERNIIPAMAVDTVIIDECHHASKNHPMALMCDLIHSRGLQPLILGMTASPTHSKKGKIRNDFSQLENRLKAQFFVPSSQIVQSLSEHRRHPVLSVAEHEESEYASLKALSSCLRDCISLDKLHYASKKLNILDGDLYSPICRIYGVQSNPTFRRIARLSSLESIVSQTAEVAGSAGYYCGLLALLEALGETCSFRGTHVAPYILYATVVIDERQSDFISEVDSKVFQDFFISLTIAAKDNPSLLLLWHDQLRCFLEVFASLVIEIVRRVIEKDRRLLSCIEEFRVKLTADDLMKVVLAKIMDESELSLCSCDKFGDFSHRLPEATAPFMQSLLTLLGSLHKNVSLRPLAVHLGSTSSTLLRRAVGNHLLSSKMLRLLQVLYNFIGSVDEPDMSYLHVEDTGTNNQSSSSSTKSDGSVADNSAIVFCSMRLLVKVLQKVVKKISEIWRDVHGEDFPINAVNMTGADTPKNQNYALDSLKSGRANVLFATEVVEEGVDVKSCNLIVNYDSPKTVKSFIQRRGRARAEAAHFICFISKPYKNQKEHEDLIKFIQQEREAERALHDWFILSSDYLLGGSAGSDCYKVPTTKASVDSHSAIRLVHDYCHSLEENAMSVQSTVYNYERNDPLFKCTLMWPQKARLPPITSEYRSQKMAAKGHAAILAVRELHRLGKLDDHLRIPMPIRLPNNANNMVDRESRLSSPSGVPDVINVQIKCVPDCLLASPSRDGKHFTLYLYSFHVNAAENLSWKIRKQIEAVESVGFAFCRPLSSKMMKQAPRMFFQNLNDDIKACLTIREYGSYKRELTKRELTAMMHFHQCLFCLQIDEMKSPDSLDSFMSYSTVNSIDYSALDMTKWAESSGGAWFVAFPLPDDSSKSFEKHLISAAQEAHFLIYNLCVLARNNEQQMKTRNFFPVTPCSVRDLDKRDDLLVSSTGRNLLFCGKEHNQNYSELSRLNDRIPNSNVTYREHFAKRNTEFLSLIDRMGEDPNYRLAKSFPVTSILTLHDLLKASHAKEKSEINDVVLEGCQLLGNAKWYYVSLILPGLAHRIKSLQLAEEALDWATAKVSNKFDFEDIALMLEAITPKLALEHLNSEKLEFYGDSVLKYLSSVTMFCQSSSGDQESLTNERIAIINNTFLTSRCQEEGLCKYLRGSPLSRGLEEVLAPPPGCNVTIPSLRNTNVQGSFPTSPVKSRRGPYEDVCVGTKTLADLFEAVLGMVYLTTGQSDEATSIFLTKLGVLNSSLEASKASFEQNILNAHTAQLTNRLSRGECAELKNMFSHEFRSPQLLVEALIHKSVQGDANYERLEFLGDAVLDMIVVQHLFSHSEMKEGQMTQEKSKRTNNSRLAKVALKMGLERFIFHDNLTLHAKLLDAKEWSLSDGNDDDHEDDSNGAAVKVFADVLEAVIGAIYLDCGFDLSYMYKIVESLGLLEC